ncbi:hypothetical protein [Candidatus Protochlamydia sp. W-9]|uniref:hypothetical protein n=1 Tax=Candidatus Protochlamydia sp. W-9 TaxID=1785087 RepID=UPI00096A9358|nr:hypothetical protein [Candidatus Protochlamydia sp. W-9]
MNIYNLSFNRRDLTVNTHNLSYNSSNEHLKFSGRIVLLCKTIFQSFLNLFFNNVNQVQLQSQWREIFWGTKEVAVYNGATNHRLGSLLSNLNPSSSSPRTHQQGNNYPAGENKLVKDPSNTFTDLNTSNKLSLEKIEPIIQPSELLFLPQGFKLSFQEGTFLHLSNSQLVLLKKKSPYFKGLWSEHFQETLQTPLALTQKEFTNLFYCLLDANFKFPLEEISSLIQLADYYLLTEVVKNLERQLLDRYKSEKFELFNSSKDSLVELKELLNFAHQYHLNALKNYLESTVVSALLNQTPDLMEFEKIINYFSNEIEELHFSRNAYLINTHLLALKNCKNLKKLYLQDCYKLTDAGLAHLTPLIALQHLDLSGCGKLTDAGLVHLAPLVALQHLGLRGCKNLTDAGLAHLTPLMALQHLDLSENKNLTDAGLVHLVPLVALQHLGLRGCKNLTDAGLAHLSPLVTLQHLDLSGNKNLTDAGLAYLTPLVALQHLNLRHCRNLMGAGLVHLSTLIALKNLDLSGCINLTDDGLTHLSPLAALQVLYLSMCNITDSGLAHLTSLVTLQKLNLSFCSNLTDAGLRHLSPLIALKHLNLCEGSNFTDAGLAHLTPLLALQYLDLSYCDKLTDAGLAQFKFLVSCAVSHLK